MPALLDRIEDEVENFRAAMEWGLDQHPEQALELVANVAMIFSWTGNVTESRSWIKAALIAMKHCHR